MGSLWQRGKGSSNSHTWCRSESHFLWTGCREEEGGPGCLGTLQGEKEHGIGIKRVYIILVRDDRHRGGVEGGECEVFNRGGPSDRELLHQNIQWDRTTQRQKMYILLWQCVCGLLC